MFGKFIATLTLLMAPFIASAAVITVDSDGSWLATNATPAATWNSDVSFNTSGWTPAFVILPDCLGTGDCIWFDGEFSTTRYAWLRKTFTVSGPIASATLTGGINDDVDVYINGVKVVNDHNGVSNALGPVDIAPYLVQGLNVIAAATEDNVPVFGNQHAFVSTIAIVTSDVPGPIPTLSEWAMLLLSGLLALLVWWRMRGVSLRR